MGAALLRVNKLQAKWRTKLMEALEEKDSTGGKMSIMMRFKARNKKHVMFTLPFVTVLRESLEAVVYIGGVSLGLPATSFPLAVICGLLAGCFVGYLMYRGGNSTSLQIFLIISTCFLYLVAADIFFKAVWYFEDYEWNQIIGGDASETGSGPGSYDIRKSVWHVNWCNPELNGGGGWGIFNAILGWTNSATYGSVISYSIYWLFVVICFSIMRWREQSGKQPVPNIKAFLRRSRKQGAVSNTNNTTAVFVETATTSQNGEEIRAADRIEDFAAEKEHETTVTSDITP